MKKYPETNDFELLSMIEEQDEVASEILLEKYKYIINILMKKYSNMAWTLGIDKNDLYQEALLGFVDAINNYQDDRNANLATFINVCVERRIKSCIRTAHRGKNKIIFDSVSLEHTYDFYEQPLMYALSDNNENNPLKTIVDEEKVNEFIDKAKEMLSDAEYEVFSLMISGLDYNEIATLLDKNPKQIDNTQQRIRGKLKKLLS